VFTDQIWDVKQLMEIAGERRCPESLDTQSMMLQNKLIKPFEVILW
jgi:hypothetical protein